MCSKTCCPFVCAILLFLLMALFAFQFSRTNIYELYGGELFSSSFHSLFLFNLYLNIFLAHFVGYTLHTDVRYTCTVHVIQRGWRIFFSYFIIVNLCVFSLSRLVEMTNVLGMCAEIFFFVPSVTYSLIHVTIVYKGYDYREMD